MKTSFKKRLSVLLLLAAAGAYLLIRPPYAVKQGWFLFSYYSSAVSIEKIAKDTLTTEKEKLLFKRIADIKNYATENLGLKHNDNYTSYLKLDHDYINLVVSASDPLKLKPRQWHFPFFGDFPYLGFFDPEGAEKETALLKNQGYDVYLRKARAFSTLGILPDPVYSYFADYSLFSLAYLIIHEQTHATLFIKSRVRFNEELATFTGHTGALAYIKDRFGKNSTQYQQARAQIQTSKDMYTFFHRFHKKLAQAYNRDTDKETRLKTKKLLFNRYKKIFLARFRNRLNAATLQWYKDLSWNNALVLSFIRYGADLSLFENLYLHNGKDIKKMLETLSILETLDTEPKSYIRQVLLSEKTK